MFYQAHTKIDFPIIQHVDDRIANNFGRLSGTTIRDTLIGVLRPPLKTQTPDKTAESTKAHGLLPIQRKGKDPTKPSMRPIRIPLERVTNLRLARG